MSKKIQLDSVIKGCFLTSEIDDGSLGIHIFDNEDAWSKNVFINKKQVEEFIEFLNIIKNDVDD